MGDIDKGEKKGRITKKIAVKRSLSENRVVSKRSLNFHNRIEISQ